MSAQPKASCRVIQSTTSYEGKQGHSFLAGISAESAGAQRLCMHLLTIPPGARTHAHLHEAHETAIYVLSGQAEMWYGENLKEYVLVHAGDFVYIPAGVPHVAGNTSQEEECLAVIARTDPNEQESVVLLPELEVYIPQQRG